MNMQQEQQQEQSLPSQEDDTTTTATTTTGTSTNNPTIVTRHRQSLLELHNDVEEGHRARSKALSSTSVSETWLVGGADSAMMTIDPDAAGTGGGDDNNHNNNNSSSDNANNNGNNNHYPKEHGRHIVPSPTSSSTSSGDRDSVNDEGTSSRHRNRRRRQYSSFLPGNGTAGSGVGGGDPDRWVQAMKQSCFQRGCQGWVDTLFPIWRWLRVYPIKQNALTDIVAGLTVAVMIVPQSMSYAKLAGLPVQYGLYSSLVPIYAYAVWGSSRQLAVGPVALISLLLNSGLTLVLDRQGKTPDNTPDYDAQYAVLALQTSVLVGLCYIGMGMLKLGFIANFLSHAVVSGFTSAAAIIIGLSQVKYLFGYDIPNEKALHKLLYNLFSNIDQFNWKTFLLGSSCVAILVGLKRLAQSFPRLKWTKAAGPLLVTVLSIILQATIDLQSRGIPIVSYIPQGLPSFTGDVIFPANFGDLSVVVISVVIVGFMESIAIAKKLAQKHGYELDASLEMVGLGMANLSSGLFGGYPVTGSFSRSAVNNESGAQSGISAIVTASMVALTLLFLTGVFELLPLATLASIVISGVISLVDYPEAIYLWKVHKFDFGVWVAAFIGTLFLGVELGLGIAVGLSLLLVLFESAYPPTSELGRLPGTTQYRNIKQYHDAQTYDGIVCVRVYAPIYFANTQHVRDKVQKYYQRAVDKLSADYKTSDEDEDSGSNPSPPPPFEEEIASVQFIVLELSAVSHIDTTGLHAIQEMASAYKKNYDVQLCLANPNPRVMKRLISSGVGIEIGREHIYVSTHDAIDDCLNHMDRQELKRRHESAAGLDKFAIPTGGSAVDVTNEPNGAGQQPCDKALATEEMTTSHC